MIYIKYGSDIANNNLYTDIWNNVKYVKYISDL
jgi:hypothetical protein